MLYVLSEQLCRRVISPFYLVKYPHAKITFDHLPFPSPFYPRFWLETPQNACKVVHPQ